MPLASAGGSPPEPHYRLVLHARHDCLLLNFFLATPLAMKLSRYELYMCGKVSFKNSKGHLKYLQVTRVLLLPHQVRNYMNISSQLKYTVNVTIIIDYMYSVDHCCVAIKGQSYQNLF